MPDENRKKVSDATKDSSSWFGGLVYVTNNFLDSLGIPLTSQSADYVIQNANAANEKRIFSSTAHRREAWHWLSEYRPPESIDLRKSLFSIDPNWYLRGFVLNSAASFWNCIDPGSEGSEFSSVGFDPGIDAYNLFKRAQGKTSILKI
ncbi:hypothetical protein ACJJID_04705 [Microbulbifer sp. CnH-101-G]|uniref:hypothetical protein n=1 Tax=Microbulbifer sp. CnH-101-G TaxID=3243393 RepID=UPI00403A78AB